MLTLNKSKTRNKNRVLVFGIMFLLVMMPFSSAAISGFGFSSSSSNPKSSSSSYTSYSYQNARDYWPALGNSDTCEASVDFLMFIRPGGCSPSVVRSDLLEEQNVPVFCKVDVIKLNPLVDINQLKSVKFQKGSDNPYVAGVSFHPNDEAIRGQKGYLDKPLINDIGYVVVLLKRQENEAAMPESVKVNITGVLRYDVEGFFGAGKQQFFLQDISEEEWERDYKENGFWKRKGYLKAEWIGEDEAQISIYRDVDEKLTSFTLSKGETSSRFYMPGFYCKAQLQVKLDDVSAPGERAWLEVDGNKMWLSRGDYFLDNECRLLDIDKVYLDAKGEVNTAEVKVRCNGKSYSLSYLRDPAAEEIRKAQLSFWEKVVNYVKEDRFGEGLRDLWNEHKESVAEIREKYEDSSSKIEEETAPTPPSQVEFEEIKDVKKYENDDLYNKFEMAESIARTLANEYGSASSGEDEQEIIWGAKALYDAAELANDIGLKEKAQELYGEVIINYLDSNYAEQAFDALNLITSKGFGYNEHNIRLLMVRKPSKDEASADFTVWTANSDGKLVKDKDSPYEKKQLNEIFSTGNFQLKEIKNRNEVEVAFGGGETFDLKIGENIDLPLDCNIKDDVKCTHRIKLDDIHIEEVAKVSLISHMPNEYSEADFSVEIGIEKRAIPLTPEKAQSKISILDESIKKWEERVASLGKLVKTWKGVCLATSAVLVVKNFFANLGGGATARQQVMPKYYKLCEHVAESDSKFNECLTGYDKEINQDIELYKKNIETLNKEILDLQNKYKNKQSGFVDSQKVVDDLIAKHPEVAGIEGIEKAEIEEIRNLILYKSIESDAGVTEYAKKEATSKITELVDRLGDRAALDTSSGLYNESLEDFLKNNEVKYYSNKKAMIVPLPYEYEVKIEDGEKIEKKSGFYVYVPEDGYTAAGDIVSFDVANVGKDGYLHIDSDRRSSVIMATYEVRKTPIGFGLTDTATTKIINQGIDAIKTANRNYGKKSFAFGGKTLYVDVKESVFGGIRCADFMSPSDCKVLFNVCDPVLCPSSRCDLGGNYHVDNVIQSGIVGSIALCMPNSVLFGGDVVVPVCLSGLHAGLDNYVQILKSYRGCLQENLDTGKYVGICDEIHSIYLCDFFWRQIGPSLDVLFTSILENIAGQGMKGGGEYLTIQDSWDNLEQSIAFMKDDYAVNSLNAFRSRSTGEIGAEICKNFVSARYPNNKDFFDNLLQPDSPIQFHAWFDEVPYSEATVPATSQYKVYYYIYAGYDQGVSYQVYLKSPPKSAYVNIQEMVVVATNFIPKGGTASETKDFTAPAGYKELCVRVNGKDECGFGKVTTGFALNYLTDMYYEEQASQRVTKREECISGSASAYSLLQPNVQSGVEEVINPDLEKKGIVRICSTEDLDKSEPNKWRKVGYCDTENVRCWLDLDSVKDVIKAKNLEENVVASTFDPSSLDKPEGMPDDEIKSGFALANDFIDSIKKGELKKEDLQKIEDIEMFKAVFAKLTEIENRAIGGGDNAKALFYKFDIYASVVRRFVALSPPVVGAESGAGVGGGEGGGILTEEPKEGGTVIIDIDGKLWKRLGGMEGSVWYQVNENGASVLNDNYGKIWSRFSDFEEPKLYIKTEEEPGPDEECKVRFFDSSGNNEISNSVALGPNTFNFYVKTENCGDFVRTDITGVSGYRYSYNGDQSYKVELKVLTGVEKGQSGFDLATGTITVKVVSPQEGEKVVVEDSLKLEPIEEEGTTWSLIREK